MLSLPGRLYRNKYYLPPLPPLDSFKDKHVLITGGNTGLGLATAVHCINLGASKVVITSRDPSKGSAAKASIETQTSTKGIVQVMHLDMGTFKGVADFADRVTDEMLRIDFVLLNAGVQNMKGAVSDDGWENTLQVNVLSTALLGLLLLPWMKIAGKGQARLGIVGSGLHRSVDISVKNGWPQDNVLKYWNDERHFKNAGGFRMYSVSKLLVIYVMRELSELAKGRDGRYANRSLGSEYLLTSCRPEVVVSAMVSKGDSITGIFFRQTYFVWSNFGRYSWLI